MRYGGYDLQKASKSQSPHSQGSFRLKKRMQNTASNIAGKFNINISDPMKPLTAFQRTGCCESPLSFQSSLFDQCTTTKSVTRSKDNTRMQFHAKDLRTEFNLKSGVKNNYVFGTNLCNFSARNALNGKSTIKIINTFKAIEENNFEESMESAYNSLQHLKNESKTVLKELIELPSCNESLEYRLVQDYLECNTYSDIENDNEFKEYLQRKNYTDILQYLEESEPKSLTSISSSVARAQSAYSKNSLNNAKILATPKALKYSKAIPELGSQLCRSCRSTATRDTKCQINDLGLLPNMRYTRRDNLKPKTANIFTSSYRDVLKYCQEFFEQSLKSDSFQLPKSSYSKFKEHKYQRVLKDFVRAQGYNEVSAYVEAKFGQLINSELRSFCRKSSKNMLNSECVCSASSCNQEPTSCVNFT